MNTLGVSSACFYPNPTEDALDKLGELGIHDAELFINTFSEIEPDFLSVIKRKQEQYQLNFISVHPFLSFGESYFLFSNYYRRYTDILPFYERFFNTTAELGAKYFIFHGAKLPGTISDEEYFERFAHLIRLGQQYGIQVCQENVVHYRSESPAYLKKMADYIGDNFGMVLDIKQSRRAGFSPDDFIYPLSKYIKHVHISDFNAQKDCIPPFEGDFDFRTFFNAMEQRGYEGAYMIELYEHSYSHVKQITDAYENTKKLLNIP